MEAAPDRTADDARAVHRFQAGDDSAFDELVLRHRGGVYRLAYRLMGGNHAEADDVSQEAFVRAYRGLRRFRAESAFRTWLTRIVVNVALNARQARRPALSLDDVATDAAGSGPAIDHAGSRHQQDAEEATLRGEVRRAIGKLSPRQRQVLTLKIYEGMKFVEIAGAAGMSVGTAKATFFQAVQRLRRRLTMRPGQAPIGREAVQGE